MARTGRWAGFVPLAAVGLGALLILGSVRAGDDAPPSPVVEVQRWVPGANGTLKRVTTIVDTRLAEPEAVMAARYPDALTESAVTAQYLTFGKWAAADIPVPVHYDDFFDPTGIDGHAQMLWAMGVWNDLPGHDFAFVDAGLSDAFTPTCTDNWGDFQNTVRFSFLLPEGVLGETCTLFGFDGIDGTEPILEFDMHMSADTEWSTDNSTGAFEYDLRSVFLHELGHAFGLDHSTVGTVMQVYLDTGEEVRTPTKDDIAGLLALYGNGETPTSSPTPTATLPPITTVPPAEKPFRATLGAVSRD